MSFSHALSTAVKSPALTLSLKLSNSPPDRPYSSLAKSTTILSKLSRSLARLSLPNSATPAPPSSPPRTVSSIFLTGSTTQSTTNPLAVSAASRAYSTRASRRA